MGICALIEKGEKLNVLAASKEWIKHTCPHGSPDIESALQMKPKITEAVKNMDVGIVDSIDTLLEKVDVVLLETNDGRPHLEKALP